MGAQEFDAIQEEYKKTLESLAEDDNLGTFKDEFQKVFDALVKSHGNETLLKDKLREMGTELATAATVADSMAGDATVEKIKEVETQLDVAQDAISE